MPSVLPHLGRRRAAVAVLAAGALAGMVVAGFGAGPTPARAQVALAAALTPGSEAVVEPAARAPLDSKRTAIGGRSAGVDCRRVACVALTFDDGPDLDTDRLLRTLRGAHVRATFFMLGIQVQRFPAVARHVAAAAEEIGDHTWDHRDLTRLGRHDAWAEVERARREIAAATQMWPAVFRPPYGSTNPMVAGLVGKLRMPVILWNVDTLDWRDRVAAVVAKRAVAQARPGSIILMHDIYPSTVDAVPAIIKGLHQRGFVLVTVSQLLGSTRPGQTYFNR